jgi:hypothetical protein
MCTRSCSYEHPANPAGPGESFAPRPSPFTHHALTLNQPPEGLLRSCSLMGSWPNDLHDPCGPRVKAGQPAQRSRPIKCVLNNSVRWPEGQLRLVFIRIILQLLADVWSLLILLWKDWGETLISFPRHMSLESKAGKKWALCLKPCKLEHRLKMERCHCESSPYAPKWAQNTAGGRGSIGHRSLKLGLWLHSLEARWDKEGYRLWNSKDLN